jgi:pyruvate/2-oxoglutarate dehydrogenase complex dihydrolipoamide acyltransferase (E2) component
MAAARGRAAREIRCPYPNRGLTFEDGRLLPIEEVHARRDGTGIAYKGRTWEQMHPKQSPRSLAPARPATVKKDARFIWEFSGGEELPQGDIYDGDWAWVAGKLVEHGKGLMYNADPDHLGLVHAGEYQRGECHGPGRSWWLTTSAVWKQNKLHTGGKPFSFEGEYRHDEKYRGLKTFKDGRTQNVGVGPLTAPAAATAATAAAPPPAVAPDQAAATWRQKRKREDSPEAARRPASRGAQESAATSSKSPKTQRSPARISSERQSAPRHETLAAAVPAADAVPGSAAAAAAAAAKAAAPAMVTHEAADAALAPHFLNVAGIIGLSRIKFEQLLVDLQPPLSVLEEARVRSAVASHHS